MNIIRATHLGMCFGVRDAITLALDRAQQTPLTIYGELVHNQAVLDTLRNSGILIESEPSAIKTDTVMITAHGSSDMAIGGLINRGLSVIEATCPLVRVAHRAIRNLVESGYHPVVVGRRGHVEVRGLTEDLPEFDIVLTDADVQSLRERPRFGVAAQTTQPIERVRELVNLIRCRFPNSEVRF